MNILNDYFIKRMSWLILLVSIHALVYVNYFCLCELLLNLLLHILLFIIAAKINGGNILETKYTDYTFHETIIGALPPEFHGNLVRKIGEHSILSA